MATMGIEEVTENAIRAVARDCGSLSMECSDVAGYVQGVAGRIDDAYEDARQLEEVTTRLLADQARVSRFDRRGAAPVRTGQGQARGRARGDRRHHRRLQGPDRTGRPAGRADGRFRVGDEPGADGFLDHRDDRPQDQHAGAQRDHRGGARRRCRAQLRGRCRRSEEARPRYPRGDQPDRPDHRRADPRSGRGDRPRSRPASSAAAPPSRASARSATRSAKSARSSAWSTARPRASPTRPA